MAQTGPDEKLRLVAVVAHPHDITHMCGTLAHHVERGDSVTAVSVTGGVRAHREKLYDELRKPPAERNMDIVLQSEADYGEQKAHEMVELCGLFGVEDVRVLPFPDLPFEATPEVVETLAEILLEVRPHMVLTHGPYGGVRHGNTSIDPGDHGGAALATHRAMGRAATPNAETKRAPHEVAAIYYTGVDFPTHEADLFVDITDQAENRLKAELLFTTQAHTTELARKRIEIGIGTAGWTARTGYAEGWVRGGPQVSRYLTITDHDLEAVDISRQELFARLGARVTKEE